MNSTKTMTTTVRIPSGFALPTCGHAFPASALGSAWIAGGDLGTTLPMGAAVRTAVSAVVRERQAVVVTDGSGFAAAYIPGTSAWRPPTC